MTTDQKTLPAITFDETVREVIALFPAAADIMMEYGLHCFSCSVGGTETLAEACRMHGFDDDTAQALLEDINDARSRNPALPQTITVTDAAALSLADIAQNEGRGDQVLCVTIDASGGFCMEFQTEVPEGDLVFTNATAPSVRVSASPISLTRIGGATIDFREGRFKLDMMKEECCGRDCGC